MIKSEMTSNKDILKITSYIGFAKKARNIHFGADKVLESTKKSDIIVSRDISSNTLNKLNNHAQKTKANITLIPERVMEQITQSDRIKVFQILDENLNDAVTKIIMSFKDLEDITFE